MILFKYDDIAYCEDTVCGTGKLTQFTGCEITQDMTAIHADLKVGTKYAIIETHFPGIDAESLPYLRFYKELAQSEPNIAFVVRYVFGSIRLTDTASTLDNAAQTKA